MKLAIVTLFIFPNIVLACSCVFYDFEESFKEASYIAIGKVSDLLEVEPEEFKGDRLKGSFNAIETLKGEKPIGFYLESSAYNIPSSCMKRLNINDSYLVFADKDHDFYGDCSKTINLNHGNKEFIEYKIGHARHLRALNEGIPSDFITELTYREFVSITKPHNEQLGKIYSRLSKVEAEKKYSVIKVTIDASKGIIDMEFELPFQENEELKNELLNYLGKIKFRKILETKEYNLAFDNA